ncbi:DUF2303 family protein [Actinomadura rubrisoli]|uniref:DUF2303 family protein n=1 Tax=Actinomadura rubrisoli TaxID=2530368 RepID=A0A4R5AZQ6_9ACTN|nr:DUF2303 family protein [Actinomadura rubrisoli]TDD77719.1 DUF2303 family protein [Actinomadura rubrisoli]
MTMTDRTENDAVIEAAITSVEPAALQPGTVYGFKFRDHVKVVDLTGDEYLDEPRRKTGTVTVDDVTSFAQYYAKHADPDSEVYTDLDAGTVTAVLDAHTSDVDVPRWQDHRLVLRMKPTEPWKTWIGKNRIALPQLAFAEHIEDNLVDIASEPVPAAEMLEIAQTFQAKTQVSYASGTRLASGDITLAYEETTDASGGAKGKLAVPKAFAIGIAPFDDVDPYKISVRLRYRIQSNKLSMIYVMDRPEDVVRDAVKSVVTKVQDATGITVMRGVPS